MSLCHKHNKSFVYEERECPWCEIQRLKDILNSRPVEKYYRTGEKGRVEVAVLVSPGHGCGWSSLAKSEFQEILAMDKDIVQAVLDGDKKKAFQIAVEKCGDIYAGGIHDVVVEWVNRGSAFVIEEHDGYERIEYRDPDILKA